MIIFFASLVASSPAYAWDSGTHRLITRIAVAVLPASPLQSFFQEHVERLQQYSTEPDTKLRDLYGRAEERRHYIDLEIYGPNPWAELLPDRRQMERKFGSATLDRSGTLPWTIEEIASDTQWYWSDNNCSEVLRQSGYLAHYIGDASQPLHSTIHYDGYDRADRGLHARIERAVDDEISGDFSLAVRQKVSLHPITDVWTVAITEIRDANLHVESFIDADRYARSHSNGDPEQYRRIFMRMQRELVEYQLARAVSVLAEVWSFEWDKAHRPGACGGVGPGFVPINATQVPISARIPAQ